MKKVLLLPAIASACIVEYEPGDNVPPLGVSNPRPREVDSREDRVKQVTQPQVDVLWVVDNSCSMAQEQADISQNAPFFMNYFLGSGLGYQIGVVSTDMYDSSQSGKLIQRGGYRWIDEDTHDAVNIFRSMIELGNGGASPERGRDSAYAALEIHKEGYNEGFQRDDAAMHLIVVSDESDFSQNLSRGEFVEYLREMKWNADLVSFSSIVTPQGGCSTASTPGTDYAFVTEELGGVTWNICDDNWDQVLEMLGLQASGMRREYFLAQLPVPDTIEVEVLDGGVTHVFEAEVDWTYEASRNSVTFVEYVPNALAEVVIRYDTLESIADGE